MPIKQAEKAKIIWAGDGFFVRQAVDNMSWLDLGECAIAIDALEQPELEDEVFEAIATTLGETPVRYVLNTHVHSDHVALNRAFERRGAEIINQDTATIPREGRWFEGASRRVQMLPLNGVHTDEDCVVWVPEDRALFTGDLFGWGMIPLVVNLNDRMARRLLDTYARLIEFDAEVVVPGHGPLATTADLRRFVDYFLWLSDEVAGACREGKTDDEIADAIGPPGDMMGWWRFEEWKHEDSLRKVLKAVRRGWKGVPRG